VNIDIPPSGLRTRAHTQRVHARFREGGVMMSARVGALDSGSTNTHISHFQFAVLILSQLNTKIPHLSSWDTRRMDEEKAGRAHGRLFCWARHRHKRVSAGGFINFSDS